MTVAAEPSGPQTNVSGFRRRRGGGLRARLAGLAAAVGVALGVLAFPQAAFAQNDFVPAINTQNPWIDVGGAPVAVSVTVTAGHQDPAGKDLNVEAVLKQIQDWAYVGISDGGGCAPSGDASVNCGKVFPNESRTITFLVTPVAESDLPEGEQKTGEFKVKVNGGSDVSTSVIVVGHAVTKTVSSITGTVTSDAEPVEGAKVVLTDAEGKTHETTTQGDGTFKFEGNANNPIAPGDMKITITKEGFEETSQDINVAGNQTYNTNVTLKQVAKEEPTSEAPTSEAATSESPEPKEEEDEGGMSGTLVFLIVIGGLLVVGGIVGIVFLLRGGKDDKDDEEDERFVADGPPDHKPTAAQVGAPGVYQAGPAPGSDAPTMLHPGGLVDSGPAAPTQFGPAYGGADSTQVMPQSGFGAPPAPPGPPMGPDGTTILPVVKQPGGPGGDATQIMPQANLGGPPPAAPPSPYADPNATRPHPGPSAPQSPYADPNATRPHPGPGPSPYGDPGATRPHPAPTPPPPATGSMFDPHNPANAPGGHSEPRYGASEPRYGASEPRYGSHGAPSAPQYGQQSQQGGPAGGFGSHSAPQGDQYPSQSMRRDPYAPPEQPAPPPTGEFGATRGMPQDPSQPPAGPYGSEPNRDGEHPDTGRTDRRSWGEWDDRPRSW